MGSIFYHIWQVIDKVSFYGCIHDGRCLSSNTISLPVHYLWWILKEVKYKDRSPTRNNHYQRPRIDDLPGIGLIDKKTLLIRFLLPMTILILVVLVRNQRHLHLRTAYWTLIIDGMNLDDFFNNSLFLVFGFRIRTKTEIFLAYFGYVAHSTQDSVTLLRSSWLCIKCSKDRILYFGIKRESFIHFASTMKTNWKSVSLLKGSKTSGCRTTNKSCLSCAIWLRSL